MWDLSCPDWEERIREGRSLLPSLPLFQDEADLAVEFFKHLRLPDVPGMPTMGEACGEWFLEIVAALFGSRDPETNQRYIEEIFALVGKKNSKTTYSAGLMLTALLMNQRPLGEFMFVGPTQAISDLAFSQASGMVRADPQLEARFHVKDHIKEVEDRLNGAKLKIKTFALDILTGPRPVGVMLDELHLLGKNPSTAKVLRQLRGGRQANPEGFMIITTTQSDEPPAGAFRTELMAARAVRDGRIKGGVLLPILYEFPTDIAKNESRWGDVSVWPMVMPNLGRSLRIDSLRRDWETESEKGITEKAIWASQHLNVEIGIALQTDRWRGADFWERRTEPGLTLESLIERCEVATVGIDGGGLDDLLGLAVIGRERVTRRWLVWVRAWAARSVLELRKDIAPRLLDFEKQGDLRLVDDGSREDVSEVADIVEQLDQAGLLPEKLAIGVDIAGITDIVDELAARGFDATEDGNGRVVGIQQGWRLTNMIKTCERRLASGEIVHADQPIMAWCVGNAKIEARGNAVTITKQVSGSAKIDPLMAKLNAAELMSRNPKAAPTSLYDDPEAWTSEKPSPDAQPSAASGFDFGDDED